MVRHPAAGRIPASPERGSSPRAEGAPFLTPARRLALFALLLLAALAFLYLWQSWQLVYWRNELHRAEQALEDLEAEHQRLKFEAAQAFTLERIERIARERLGMVRPPPRYLVLPRQP